VGGHRQGRGHREGPVGTSSAGSLRFAALAAAAVAGLACAASGAPSLPAVGARGDVWLRVLLFEGVDEVVVVSQGRETRIRAVPGEGLRAGDGRPLSSWRAPGGDGNLELRSSAGTTRVRGAVEVLAVDGAEVPGRGGLVVVNEVPLEEYLAGTLGREMYGSWDLGALKAQAVASRTYALHELEVRRDAPWHLRAGTRSQVYGGVEAESERVAAALEATRGEVLVENGHPILAAFHSSSGGRTASAREVWGEERSYLVSVPVEDEWDSPDSYWRARVTRGTLGRAVASLGTDVGPIAEVKILDRTDSGRVARVQFRGERGEVILTGRQLRGALGESKLKSTLFELREDGESFVFVGSGRGHGVGMSQWGARAMARRGDDYREILATFYPGAQITRLPGLGR
jgi:stage II sporulation protein D